MTQIRRSAWAGLLVTMTLIPWIGHAADQWSAERGFGLQESTDGRGAPPAG